MLRSRIDPVLYVRTVHVGDTELSAETIESLASALDTSRALDAWRAQHASSGALLFEEAFRYWMGLRLPFLYRHAVHALQAEIEALRSLREPSVEWRRWRVHIPVLHALDRVWLVGSSRDGSAHAVDPALPHDPLDRVLGRISCEDLVDALAVLTTFRIHSPTSAWSDPVAFDEYSPGAESARRVVRIASDVLRDADVALRALGPLVAAALSTTQPVSAFVLFLERLANVAGSDQFAFWVRQPEPHRWHEIFNRFRHELPGEAGAGTQDTSEGCAPLDLACLTSSSTQHPLLTARAREWQSRADEEAAYGWFIEQAPWAPAHVSDAIWRDFQPPLSLYAVRRHDGTQRVLLGLDTGAFEALGVSMTREDAQELMTLHGVVQRAAGVTRVEDDRLCGHTSCPEFRLNYCSSYAMVPRDHHRCMFPIRLAQLSRRISNPAALSVSDLDDSV